jgi:RimJ/RimL family protein N-acetyltransferase
MHLRALTIDDAAAYHAFRLEGLRLHPDAFRSAYEDDAKKPVEWAQKRIAPASDNPHGFALGAFDEATHQLIGATSLETSASRKVKHVAHVLGMFVSPAHTGKGIGASLLQALIAKAQLIPELEILHLTVTSSNESAIALYERHGFTRDGIERRALKIGAQYFDKLHMSRLL